MAVTRLFTITRIVRGINAQQRTWLNSYGERLSIIAGAIKVIPVNIMWPNDHFSAVPFSKTHGSEVLSIQMKSEAPAARRTRRAWTGTRGQAARWRGRPRVCSSYAGPWCQVQPAGRRPFSKLDACSQRRGSSFTLVPFGINPRSPWF